MNDLDEILAHIEFWKLHKEKAELEIIHAIETLNMKGFLKEIPYKMEIVYSPSGYVYNRDGQYIPKEKLYSLIEGLNYTNAHGNSIIVDDLSGRLRPNGLDSDYDLILKTL